MKVISKGGETLAGLAQNIKRIRTELGISQEELARRSGTTLATINRIETATQENPKLDTIKKIAEGLGTTIGELCGESPVEQWSN